MGAPGRVSIEELKAALTASHGNQVAAAAAVGLSRNNFLKRLDAARVDLDAFRTGHPVRAVRIHAARFETLRQAGFDLSYRHRRDYGPEQVLEEFIADAFDAWLSRAKGGPTTPQQPAPANASENAFHEPEGPSHEPRGRGDRS